MAYPHIHQKGMYIQLFILGGQIFFHLEQQMLHLDH